MFLCFRRQKAIDSQDWRNILKFTVNNQQRSTRSKGTEHGGKNKKITDISQRKQLVEDALASWELGSARDDTSRNTVDKNKDEPEPQPAHKPKEVIADPRDLNHAIPTSLRIGLSKSLFYIHFFQFSAACCSVQPLHESDLNVYICVCIYVALCL